MNEPQKYRVWRVSLLQTDDPHAESDKDYEIVVRASEYEALRLSLKRIADLANKNLDEYAGRLAYEIEAVATAALKG